MIAVKFDKEKLDRTLRKLDRFKKSTKKRILRKAVRAAGRVGVKSAKSNAPRNSGLSKRALTQRVTTRKNGVVLSIVGANRKTQGNVKLKRRWSDKEVFHKPSKTNHLINEGTKPHLITLPNGGTFLHPGMRPLRFMNRSAALAEREAVNRFVDKSVVEIIKQGGSDNPSEYDDGN